MSIHPFPSQFERNVTPVDPEHQARLSLAIMLMEDNVPIHDIEDVDGYARTLAGMRDALDILLDEVAFEQRRRGTSQYDIKRSMQNTCPLMAALYRAEAIADHRIAADQSAISKLCTIHDLLVQGIEEKHGGKFDNPIYPVSGMQPVSKAKRWRKQAERVNEGRE